MKTITHKDREFELEALDAVLLLRVLKTVSGVLKRDPDSLKAVMDAYQKQDNEKLFVPLLNIIVQIEEEDLLKLATGVFQVRDMRAGMDYFAKNGVDLDALLAAIATNIELTEGMVQAVGSFLHQAGLVTANPPAETKTAA